ncbi:hypothetical protein SCLCIDRAFT_1220530 [Scleroderma citrinum Foug A]|uniref:Ricin B lectin domain-containing protein n=1 Tax=Scleroderma citrinum Foug A TaxID=1036808 RepID=A0A0C3DIV5_9AGAM|nr:hypothetical protein SCLCIDRAFT_1220530 [Scleroderma citrinum Foug A]
MSNSPTCQLTDGNYNILTDSGEYLGISNNSLAVNNYPTLFYVKQVQKPPKCTYQITVYGPYNFIQDKGGNVTVGSYNQQWVITQDGDVYNVGLQNDPKNVWTDHGGSPGPGRRIFIDNLDSSGSINQQFKFRQL